MGAVVNGEANIRVIPNIVAGTTQSADAQSSKNKSNQNEVKNV
jgi:hypothetical protein